MASASLQLPARERLLAVATRLFIEHGFAGTPVSRIVREAGVTMPVLYYHFGNKAELLRAVFDARGQWIRTELKVDPAIGFAPVCKALVDHALEHLDDLRDGLRLRVLLGFETGPEVDTLRAVTAQQRARSLAGISALFAAALPGISPRRCGWLAETYLSGVQGLAMDLTGVSRRSDLSAAKGQLLLRMLGMIATMPEVELPQGLG